VLTAATFVGIYVPPMHDLVVEGCVVGGLFLCIKLVALGHSLGAKHEREKLSAEERMLVDAYRASQRFDQIDAAAEARMRDIAARYRR